MITFVDLRELLLLFACNYHGLFVSLPTFLQIEMKGIININDIHKSGSENRSPLTHL
jgi:hypothetical protein